MVLIKRFSILVFLLSVAAADAQEPISDEAIIHGRMTGWLEAWNQRDAVAVSSYYDDDADWTHAHGLTRSGKEEIYNRYRELFAATLPDSVKQRLTLEILSVRLITEDVAVVDAEYVASGLLAAPTLTVKGRTTVVMVRRDGTWLRSVHRNWIPITPDCLKLCADR